MPLDDATSAPSRGPRVRLTSPTPIHEAFHKSGAFDYFQHCVHCGLCLPRCPTYVELADENDSPRGRIHLMQALSQNRLRLSPAVHRHLELCLNCRACETACPSGVEYGELIEGYRANVAPLEPRETSLLNRLIHLLVLNVLPSVWRTRLLLSVVRGGRALGLFEFLASSGALPNYSANLAFGELLERLPRCHDELPEHAVPSRETPRAHVGLFMGCVGEAVLGTTNRATHRVLLHNGCAVRCPRTQGCCGALHYHHGDVISAQRLAKQNIDAFGSSSEDAVVVNVAGCGFMLKSYDQLLADDPGYRQRAVSFACRVRDVHEFLVELPLVPPPRGLPRTVTYHDACHLCHGQRIRGAPRQLLGAIPEITLAEMRESDFCCGAAGSYSLTQPAMAGRLARRKLTCIDATGAHTVASGNAGCTLHLLQHATATGRTLDIVHPVELLDEAYALREDHLEAAEPRGSDL